jgi:hypothetical protein
MFIKIPMDKLYNSPIKDKAGWPIERVAANSHPTTPGASQEATCL